MKLLILLALIAVCEPTSKPTRDCHGAVRMPAAAGESRPDVAPLSSPEQGHPTPHDYLYHDQPEAALALLNQDRSWIHRRNEDGATVLHLAVGYEHIEVVKWLLDNGAGVASGGDLAEAVVRDAERAGESIRGNVADGAGDVPPTGAQRIRVPDGNRPPPQRPLARALTARRGVNGYLFWSPHDASETQVRILSPQAHRAGTRPNQRTRSLTAPRRPARSMTPHARVATARIKSVVMEHRDIERTILSVMAGILESHDHERRYTNPLAD